MSPKLLCVNCCPLRHPCSTVKLNSRLPDLSQLGMDRSLACCSAATSRGRYLMSTSNCQSINADPKLPNLVHKESRHSPVHQTALMGTNGNGHYTVYKGHTQGITMLSSDWSHWPRRKRAEGILPVLHQEEITIVMNSSMGVGVGHLSALDTQEVSMYKQSSD